MSADMKNIGLLILGLFLIMVIVAVTYLGAGYLKETVCEQQDTNYEWQSGACYNESGADSTTVTVTAITKITAVEGIVDVVLGLLTLVVLILLFKIVIRVAKGFSSNGGM